MTTTMTDIWIRVRVHNQRIVRAYITDRVYRPMGPPAIKVSMFQIPVRLMVIGNVDICQEAQHIDGGITFGDVKNIAGVNDRDFLFHPGIEP